jgi:hypothetical protein
MDNDHLFAGSVTFKGWYVGIKRELNVHPGFFSEMQTVKLPDHGRHPSRRHLAVFEIRSVGRTGKHLGRSKIATAFQSLGTHSRMPVRTITIDVALFERLATLKRHPQESIEAVIERLVDETDRTARPSIPFTAGQPVWRLEVLMKDNRRDD